MNNVNEVLEERGSRYGDFNNHAELAQDFKDTFKSHANKYGHSDKFTPQMIEGIEMIFHKLARIANGDPTYDDNYVDIAGYAELIVRSLKDEEFKH